MAGQIFVLRPGEGYAFSEDGVVPQIAHEGMTAREGHPVMKGRESLWVPLVPTFEIEDKEPAKPAKAKQAASAPAPAAAAQPQEAPKT